MKNFRHMVSAVILISISAIGLSAQTQREPYRISTPQIGNILRRLEQSAGRFRGSLNRALISANIDETRRRNDINSFEPDFVTSVEQFRDRFNRRAAVAADAQNILQKASLVNGFMTRNRLTTPAQNDWASVRTDLDALASAFGLSWQWNTQTLPPANSSKSSRLSTGELDQLIQRIETGGDTFRSSLTAAFGRGRYNRASSETNMNEAVRNLKSATDQLRNQFDARQPVTDYVERVLARATPVDTYMRNNRLTNQAQSDWTTLRGNLNALAGAYNLSANWQSGPESVPGNTRATSGDFIVRDGETVVAVLNNDLTTNQTKQGDRFTMTVRDPGQYEGAVIEGTVGAVNQGGRLTGRSGISLNFDTIRLRNGQTYKFAGTLGNVRTLNGDAIKIDNEGSAEGDNQTTQTATRAGIGTAVGAIIGAVAGGGKGAAIGGIVGAAGGAGSVYVTGKDSLELPRGTELTIRAGAPR